MKTVMITGADRGVGHALTELFLEGGWHVLAGQYMPEWPQLAGLKKTHADTLDIIPLDVGSTESVQAAADMAAGLVDHVDMLVNCAAIAMGDDAAHTRAIYNVNVVGVVRMVESFLPLMQTGMKRLAFFSSECGAISVTQRVDGFAYTTSKTALNMTVHCMFRELRPQGFTFRLYHPGWVRSYMSGEKATQGKYEPEEAAAPAYRQFVSDRDAEDVLIMTDVKDEMWPY